MKTELLIITLIAGQALYAGGNDLDPVVKGHTLYELGSFEVEKSYSPIIVDAKMLPTYEVT